MIAEAPAAPRPITDEGIAPGLFTFRPVEDEQGMLSFDRVDTIAVPVWSWSDSLRWLRWVGSS